MDLLKRLTTIPGVPGREQRIRTAIAEYAKAHELFDSTQTDSLGNLICLRRPRSGGGTQRPVRVLVAAHMDQVGFLVSHVSAQGTLRVHPVGSFDPRVLFSCRVIVCASSGDDFPGVMNPVGRPIHTASAEELRRVPEIADVVVDLALPPEVVREKVKLGDMIVFDAPFQIVGDAVVTSGLDDRVGCWALLAALTRLERHACEIHAVFTVQEELGSRGAGPATFGVEPDIGIACDTTVCCDLPDIPPEQQITQAGQGVSIQIADSSTISDSGLVDAIEELARRAKIPCQRSLMLGGGQDGALIQRSRAGVRTLVLSCPVRYLHTPAELAFRRDLESYRDLLAGFLREI